MTTSQSLRGVSLGKRRIGAVPKRTKDGAQGVRLLLRKLHGKGSMAQIAGNMIAPVHQLVEDEADEERNQ